MGTFLTVILSLLVVAVAFGLVWWVIDFCKTPEPFNRILKIIMAIGAVVYLVGLLFGHFPPPNIPWIS